VTFSSLLPCERQNRTVLLHRRHPSVIQQQQNRIRLTASE